MRAGRAAAVWRWGDDLRRVHSPRRNLALDHFARQGARHEHRPAHHVIRADPVAMVAQPFDCQPHSAASSSVPMKPPD